MNLEIYTPPKAEQSRSEFQSRLKKFDSEGVQQIMYAYDFARWAHGDQRRVSGNNYFEEHLVGAAIILIDEVHISNPNTVAGALLHDVIEDTKLFKRIKADCFEEKMDISEQMLDAFGFNPAVREIVLSLTKPKIDGEYPTEEVRTEIANERLTQATPEALLVKLADKLQNMRTLLALPRERQDRILTETLSHQFKIFNSVLRTYPAEGRYLIDKLFDEICNVYAIRSY